jgi:ATP-dependent Clp protease ATP-binding subunit ClpA
MILIFTLNLPDGADEKLSRKLGFASYSNRTVMTDELESELKKFLSGALLSRIGRPILCETLTKESLGLILERALREAIHRASELYKVSFNSIEIDKGTGFCILSSMDVSLKTDSFGARRIYDTGREFAARAMRELNQTRMPKRGANIFVRPSQDGRHIIIEEI